MLKDREKIQGEIYEELKEFMTTNGGANVTINEMVENIKKNEDALSRVLTDYIVKNASTDEEQNKLRQHFAYAITSYLTFDCICKKNAKRDVAEKIISEISFENYIGVKSAKGDQVAASIIPKALVKNKSNEEIIEMAKSCPNFDLIEGGEISIMTDDELKDYLQKAKNAVVNEQDKEEKEECQTQTV